MTRVFVFLKDGVPDQVAWTLEQAETYSHDWYQVQAPQHPIVYEHTLALQEALGHRNLAEKRLRQLLEAEAENKTLRAQLLRLRRQNALLLED